MSVAQLTRVQNGYRLITIINNIRSWIAFALLGLVSWIVPNDTQAGKVIHSAILMMVEIGE